MLASIYDIPVIRNEFMNDREVALDKNNKQKPIMDNRCSKGHSLFNPTAIHNGKIILKENNERKKVKYHASARSK